MGNALYGFICDENAMHLASYFPHGRAKTVKQFGLLGESDDAILAKAWDSHLIVVTSNRDDFRERFLSFVPSGGKRKCTHLHGLVMFAETKDEQIGLFPSKKLERRLRLDGKAVTWRDVYQGNLLVRANPQRASVERLSRCPGCRRLGAV